MQGCLQPCESHETHNSISSHFMSGRSVLLRCEKGMYRLHKGAGSARSIQKVSGYHPGTCSHGRQHLGHALKPGRHHVRRPILPPTSKMTS